MELEKCESDTMWSKYINKELIGTGSNGNRVYRVLNTKDKKIYAMKKIIINKSDEDKYINEISIFKGLNHPNIIKYFDSFVRNDKLFIIMEYAGKGDLKSVIRKRTMNDYDYLNEDQVWKWFAEITAAVKYLHSRKIIHRDIKVENIFLSQDNSVKLGDFGISKVLEHTMDLANSGVGTPYYLSPEICQGLKYNFKTDIWMMGCLLYELCSLDKPFRSESIKVLIRNIVDMQPEPMTKMHYSEGLTNLITLMLKKLPEERPGIEEVWVRIHMLSKHNILKHPSHSHSLYKSIDKNKLKIEVEEESSENNFSPPSSLGNGNDTHQIEEKSTPISHMNLEYKNKLEFSSKIVLQECGQNKKFTPSHCRKDVDKIRKNMQISPINTPIEVFSDCKRRTSSTTTNSTPKNVNTPIIKKNILGNISNTSAKTNKDSLIMSTAGKNFRNRHYRHISINISSIQSPEHKAIYQIENIEKVEKLEFPSPIHNPVRHVQINPQMNKSNKATLTPTNVSNMNKISPKEGLIQRECPNTTKVGGSAKKKSNPEDSFLRRSLIRNFLIERYGKEKFEVMYNEIIENNFIDEKKIIEVVGDDYKVAINYLKYLTGKNK